MLLFLPLLSATTTHSNLCARARARACVIVSDWPPPRRWNVEMESVRRTFRRSVREAFDRLDRNKDGAITKYEFGLMMRKRKLRKSMRLMQEHNGEVFDVDKDWAELEAEAAITKIAKGPGLSSTRSVNSPKVVERTSPGSKMATDRLVTRDDDRTCDPAPVHLPSACSRRRR